MECVRKGVIDAAHDEIQEEAQDRAVGEKALGSIIQVEIGGQKHVQEIINCAVRQQPKAHCL